MCLSLFRKKHEELLYLHNIPVLSRECCPKCQQREAVCYYDTVENDTYRYEFICLNCSDVFTVSLSIVDHMNRSNDRAMKLLLELRDLLTDDIEKKKIDAIMELYCKKKDNT